MSRKSRLLIIIFLSRIFLLANVKQENARQENLYSNKEQL